MMYNLSMESEKTNGQTINIGKGKELAVLELAEKVIELVGKKGKIKPKFFPERKGEIMRRCPDVTKMNKILGFKTKFSLDEGLKKTIEYYRKE